MTIESLLYRFIRPVAPDWFARRYRSQHAARMLQVQAADIVSKIGVCNVGSSRNGYRAFLQTIKDAGRRISVVVCYDDFGAAFEAKEFWPETLTVGMLTNTDFGFDYNAFKLKTQQNPWVDYWAVYNEIGGQSPAAYARQADSYISLLPRMAADGIRLAMFSLASGTPPTVAEDGGACYAEIARATKYAVDNNYDALLLAHEYVGAFGRYQNLIDYLVPRGAMLPLVISEWGDVTFHNTAQMIDMIRANDPLYMGREWVEGCANWTVGGGGWAGSNWSVAFPEVGQYIATVAPVVVDPPPDTEYEFVEWIDGTTGLSLGNANPLTFIITSDMQVRAVFQKKVPPPIKRTCQTSVSPDGAGTVTGGGVYNDGDTVTLTARAA